MDRLAAFGIPPEKNRTLIRPGLGAHGRWPAVLGGPPNTAYHLRLYWMVRWN